MFTPTKRRDCPKSSSTPTNHNTLRWTDTWPHGRRPNAQTPIMTLFLQANEPGRPLFQLDRRRTCGYRNLGSQSSDIRADGSLKLNSSSSRTPNNTQQKQIPGRNDMRTLMMAAAFAFALFGGAA